VPTEVILPQLGESVAEGVITRWLKKPGDTVQAEEPLVEVTTDKVNVELPSPVTGVVQELRAAEGETVPVEKVIAIIAEQAGAAAPAARSTAEGPAAPTAPAPSGRKVKLAPRNYSPLVRKIAESRGLDLDFLVNTGQVIGTGEGGRVTKADLLAVIECLDEPSAAAPVTAPATPVAAQPAPAAPVPPAPEAPAPSPREEPAPPPIAAPPVAPSGTAEAAPAADEEDLIVPFTGMRKAIADHLVKSAFTAPHVTTVAEADVTRMVAYRAANKDTWEREYKLRLTYTPFFVKATADALLAYPMVNAQIQGDRIVAKRVVHMGVAVSLGTGGLIVPVIKNAHRKDVLAIAAELEDLARKARDNRLTPADVQGGTFTITNPGVFGAILSTPIIHTPQSAILGVEAIRKMAVVRDDDSIAIRSMMYLCLSYDHRVIDGETAIKFLQHLRRSLEEFRFLR